MSERRDDEEPPDLDGLVVHLVALELVMLGGILAGCAFAWWRAG